MMLMIRKVSFSFAVIALSASLFSNSSEAFFFHPERCKTDDLNQSKVIGRNAWFKKCFPGEHRMLFRAGYRRYNNQNYDRDLYVTFGVEKPDGSISYPGDWKAPTDENSPCDVPTTPDGEYGAIGACQSGCYHPSQELLFADGWMSILEAKQSGVKEAVTLSDDATFENPKTKLSTITHIVGDIRDAQQEMLEIKTQSGGRLEVTQEHPLLDSQGKMRRADTLVAFKDALIGLNGQPDLITEVVGKEYYGKVYNLSLESEDELENIVFAQGFMNGSLYYQSGNGVSKLNQVIFRQKVLPSNLLPSAVDAIAAY